MARFLAAFLLNPLWHFWLAIVLAIILFFGGYRQATKYLLAYAAIWLFAISMSPLPQLLVHQRERRYAVVDTNCLATLQLNPAHILVLGAGHTNAPGFSAFDRLSEPALKRFLEGYRLQRALPQSKLVCSGYSSSGRESQAEAIAKLALDFGVSPQDTLLQPKAFNTEAEARTYAQRFGNDTPLILVTSALHMPRAMFWFRHYGLDPIPAPTNYLVMPDPGYETFTWGPSTRKIAMTRKLLHEYAGMLYAKWKVRK